MVDFPASYVRLPECTLKIFHLQKTLVFYPTVCVSLTVSCRKKRPSWSCLRVCLNLVVLFPINRIESTIRIHKISSVSWNHPVPETHQPSDFSMKKKEVSMCKSVLLMWFFLCIHLSSSRHLYFGGENPWHFCRRPTNQLPQFGKSTDPVPMTAQMIPVYK